jgi:transcriptional regulator with XRE-family HTH domain
MSDSQELVHIRRKIMGALLADARQSSGRSLQECAGILGISEADYAGYESGVSSPTLPQLEVLAYFFKVPIEHFWGDKTVAVARAEDEVKASVMQFTVLRDKIIGATLRGLRDDAGLTLENLSGETGIGVEQLAAYEMGQQPAPIHDLQTITNTLKVSMDELIDDRGRVGGWLRSQSEFGRFSELPEDVREFILMPINRSYLDLAIRLSGLSVERLRGIAEGILDITY